jgi:hypothetical protein
MKQEKKIIMSKLFIRKLANNEQGRSNGQVFDAENYAFKDFVVSSLGGVDSVVKN